MFKIQIGDEVICKLNNKKYEVTSTTTSSDGTGKSSFRIKMQDENKNSIEVDKAIFEEMFSTNNWSDWIDNNIFLFGNISYKILYRYNDKMFEMKRADNKGKIVTAKVHKDDKFDFVKGFEIVELKMKKQILKEQLESIEKQLKQY